MIPARYEKAEYTTDVPENVKVLVRAMRDESKGIFIHGTVGTGKTHIAWAIKKQWDLVHNHQASFWNTTELFEEIKEDYSRPNIEKTRVLERLMDSKSVLFLDDIGSERPTEWVMERFYLLVNKRYNDMVPIVFTSNLSVGELASRIGDRTVSRIVEMCNVVRLDGADRRLSK